MGDAASLLSMVEVLVANCCAAEAWELANSVWQDPSLYLCGHIAVYSAILRGFSKSKQHDKVLALYDEMTARRIHMNTVTYNTVLNSISHGGHMDRVPQILTAMKAMGPRAAPDAVTFSTIIKGCCLSGDLDSGLEVLDFVKRETEIQADQFAYHSLLDCCAKQGNLQAGLQLLDRMRSDGVTMSNYTLSIAVKLLGRARLLKQAFELVEDVSQVYSFKPNIQVYTCLIQACIQGRKIGKAFELHNKILDEGVDIDARTYTVLAQGCLSSGAVHKAAMVVRCAYHLPCGSFLRIAEGSPRGVETSCLGDVLKELVRVDSVAAAELRSELAPCSASLGC